MKKLISQANWKKMDAGLTLVEITVAILVASVAILGTTQVMLSITKTSKSATTVLRNLTDDVIVHKELSSDLQLAGPSFNNLVNIPANSANDSKVKEFFEYRYDMKCLTDCERILTLSATSPGSLNEIHLLIEDPRDQTVVLYPPAKAYNIQKVTDVSTLPPGAPIGTLEFAGLNNGGFLKDLHSGFWTDGSLLMLYSMVEVREPASLTATSLPIDFTNPGTKLVLVGGVHKDSFSPQTLDGKLRPLPNYLQDSSRNPLDSFFRGLPPAGGQAVFAFLQRVRFIKLKMEKMKIGNNQYTGKLIRYEYQINQNGNFGFSTKGLEMASNLKSVVFRRENISMPTIEFTVNWDASAKMSSTKAAVSSGGK